MHLSALRYYRSPLDGGELGIGDAGAEEVLTEGVLRSAAGHSFRITGGIVDFTSGTDLSPQDESAKRAYDAQAGEIYENAMRWLWEAFYADEREVRGWIVDQLKLEPGQRVLETGCGTGSDSELIAAKLGSGELFLQDISGAMIRHCQKRLSRFEGPLKLHYSLAAGNPLPFADKTFDRVFHFGGLNMFSDIRGSLGEMARVTKPGGLVVVGDESMAPWLRDTDYGRIIINNNRLYEAPLPLDKLPEAARDVRISYILGNTFYVIAFAVGEGLPPVNIDLPHKGRRGGTMRTRYFGQLEGVTPEVKAMVEAAARAAGSSIHEWLDRTLRDRAQAEIDRDR